MSHSRFGRDRPRLVLEVTDPTVSIPTGWRTFRAMSTGFRLAIVTLVVDDYDRAIDYYCSKLGFTLEEDQPQGAKRFVRVRPPGGGCDLLLARAKNADELSRVGDQTGGRVGFFLHTDDFDRDYGRLLEGGIDFVEQPRHESYGSVVVFRDIYGNKWDLVEPK